VPGFHSSRAGSIRTRSDRGFIDGGNDFNVGPSRGHDNRFCHITVRWRYNFKDSRRFLNQNAICDGFHTQQE